MRFQSRPNLFWPIILIGLGILLLLDNTGALTRSPWAVIWNLWPLLLIAAGVYILFGRGGALQNSLVSGLLAIAIVAVVLVLSLTDVPGLNLGGQTETRQFAYPLAGVTSAELDFDFGSGRYKVYALNDSNNLIDSNLTYSGNLVSDVNASGEHVNVTLRKSGGFGFFFGPTGGDEWNIGLNRNAAYDLNLDLGSGGANLDFSELPLRGGRIDIGSGGATLDLPASGQYQLRMNGGSGSIRIRIPRTAEVRIEYDHGSGGFFSNLSRLSVDGGDDFDAQTSGFASAENAITLVIDGGSGSISIEDR